MAFNVSGLTAFNDEFSAKLVAKAILKTETINKVGVTLFPDVKAGSTLKLNKVKENITPRAAGCSFSAAGATVYSQSNVAPKAFQVDKSYCPDTLSPYYMAQQMKGSTHQEDFTESQFIFDLVTDEILKYNEKIMWVGDTDDGDLIDGWLTQLEDDSERIEYTTSATTENIGTVVEDMYDKLVDEAPEILDRTDLVMLMSPQNFAAYGKHLRAANNFHYTGQNDFAKGIVIPGTNVKVMSINGLVETDAVVLTYAENLVVAIDGVSDADTLESWYSKDNQEIRAVSKWTLGVGYYFADQIVTNF